MSLALLSDPGINHTTANDDHLQLRAITSLYPDTSALGIQTIRHGISTASNTVRRANSSGSRARKHTNSPLKGRF